MPTPTPTPTPAPGAVSIEMKPFRGSTRPPTSAQHPLLEFGDTDFRFSGHAENQIAKYAFGLFGNRQSNVNRPSELAYWGNYWLAQPTCGS